MQLQGVPYQKRISILSTICVPSFTTFAKRARYMETKSYIGESGASWPWGRVRPPPVSRYVNVGMV